MGKVAMPPIDLINCVPEILADSADLHDLLTSARKTEKWEERQAEVLDYIYRSRIIQFIRKPPQLDEMQALIEHLDRMTHPTIVKKFAHLTKPYAARWGVYMDLLDSRLSALQSQAPQALLERTHFSEILAMIAPGKYVAQQEIGQRLGLQRANLTRILNLMEANELIERETIGRENRIRLGQNGIKIYQEKEGTSSRQQTKRGSSYLKIAA